MSRARRQRPAPRRSGAARAQRAAARRRRARRCRFLAPSPHRNPPTQVTCIFFLKRRDDETTNMIATRDESRNQDRYLISSRLTRHNLSSSTPPPRPKAHCATIGARSGGSAAEAVFSHCLVVLGIAGAHALAALVVAARAHSNSKDCCSCCIRRERVHARHSSLIFVARFVGGSADLCRVTRR